MKRIACSGLLGTAWAALGALVWTGCSSAFQTHASGDVYCDQTGCYQCDGYNCTPATSASGATPDSGPVTVVTASDASVVAKPDASAPDASAPDASAPDASAPDASAPDAAAPPECVSSEDCRAELPQSCVGGYCRYTCATSEQCALIDARLDVCNAADAGAGYCVSSGGE